MSEARGDNSGEAEGWVEDRSVRKTLGSKVGEKREICRSEASLFERHGLTVALC